MAEVLCVYREVQVLKKAAAGKSNKSDKPVAIVSYDEKPGIQAIATRLSVTLDAVFEATLAKNERLRALRLARAKEKASMLGTG